MSERYRKPQTIDELKRFCAERGMPLEQMRFFIGEDYRGARAFGVYETEDGDFVVYKNKANGERAIRYQGPNEAYAVNELYEKLKSETEQRRASPSKSTSVSRGGVARRTGRPLGNRNKRRLIIAAALIVFIAGGLYAASKQPDRGYYQYGGNSYYFDNSDWYGYDDSFNNWYLIKDIAEELEDHYNDYYVSEYYDDAYGVSDFRDSAYYDYSYDYSYDDDSDYDSYYSDSDDYDWDYDWDDDDWDSWDSYDTDWDSDW